MIGGGIEPLIFSRRNNVCMGN